MKTLNVGLQRGHVTIKATSRANAESMEDRKPLFKG